MPKISEFLKAEPLSEAHSHGVVDVAMAWLESGHGGESFPRQASDIFYDSAESRAVLCRVLTERLRVLCLMHTRTVSGLQRLLRLELDGVPLGLMKTTEHDRDSVLWVLDEHDRGSILCVAAACVDTILSKVLFTMVKDTLMVGHGTGKEQVGHDEDASFLLPGWLSKS